MLKIFNYENPKKRMFTKLPQFRPSQVLIFSQITYEYTIKCVINQSQIKITIKRSLRVVSSILKIFYKGIIEILMFEKY